jgi:hypothetical protein
LMWETGVSRENHRPAWQTLLHNVVPSTPHLSGNRIIIRIIRGIMFISQEWHKRAEKASLLTASGVLLHAFPSMFVT